MCYTPIPLGDVRDAEHPRCGRHVGVVRLSREAVVTVPDAPRLRSCPSCGGDTFRAAGVCSRCDDTPPLRPVARLSNHGPKPRRKRTTPPVTITRFPGRTGRPLRPYGKMDGRIVPAVARALAEQMPTPVRADPRNGVRLDPDDVRWNRTLPGRPVVKQRPAMEKALALMAVPGEWEVLAYYRDGTRVKAAVWYLRHVVTPKLPPGRWEFRRCTWERAAVMGRYDRQAR